MHTRLAARYEACWIFQAVEPVRFLVDRCLSPNLLLSKQHTDTNRNLIGQRVRKRSRKGGAPQRQAKASRWPPKKRLQKRAEPPCALSLRPPIPKLVDDVMRTHRYSGMEGQANPSPGVSLRRIAFPSHSRSHFLLPELPGVRCEVDGGKTNKIVEFARPLISFTDDKQGTFPLAMIEYLEYLDLLGCQEHGHFLEPAIDTVGKAGLDGFPQKPASHILDARPARWSGFVGNSERLEASLVVQGIRRFR